MVNPDRKIRCGPFSESDMPIELLLDYHNKHRKEDNNTPNSQIISNTAPIWIELRPFLLTTVDNWKCCIIYAIRIFLRVKKT
jgi:hypothetical protein